MNEKASRKNVGKPCVFSYFHTMSERFDCQTHKNFKSTLVSHQSDLSLLVRFSYFDTMFEHFDCQTHKSFKSMLVSHTDLSLLVRGKYTALCNILTQ